MHDVSKHTRQDSLRRAGACALDTSLARCSSSTSAHGTDARWGGKGRSEASPRGGEGDRDRREEGGGRAQEGRRWRAAERWGGGVLGCAVKEGTMR